MHKEFDDKKTTKSKLWNKIAKELSNRFNITEGDGKGCRQKFSNLSKTYIAYVNHQKKTGEEKIESPPFFEELHSIIGKILLIYYEIIIKYFVNPQNMEDTMPSLPSVTQDTENNNVVEKTDQSTVQNRFKARNTKVRPRTASEQILHLILHYNSRRSSKSRRTVWSIKRTFKANRRAERPTNKYFWIITSKK